MMITEKITTIKLIASEGMTLTDGEHFGKEIYLGTGDSADNWHEISDAEAQKMQKELLSED
ncbi:MAG: hypothetical protein IKL42_05465 [Clostridia bacterium]|nr:hypothetical protein [Clostridia bacterium]MBR3576832.1 hypothetical protein [Clostridia bacterium]